MKQPLPNLRVCFLIILLIGGARTEPYAIVGSVYPDNARKLISTLKVQSSLQRPDHTKERNSVKSSNFFDHNQINPNEWNQYWGVYYKTLLHKLQRQADRGR